MEALIETLSQSREDGTVKLNLGGGTGPVLDGYEIVDRKNGGEIYPLAYPDNRADEIRASHCLEHLSHNDTLAAVKDWFRVLKPGGKLKIAVPDFAICADQYCKGNRHNLPIHSYIVGGQGDADDFHRSIFDEDGLYHTMHAAGLRRVRRWKSEVNDCANLPVSLNLEGIKLKPVNCHGRTWALSSVPRLGFNATHRSIYESLPALGIPMFPCEGVFWHHALTSGMERAVKGGIEFILAIDYDTAFTLEMVEELHRLMDEHPEADAIAGLQVRRDAHSALVAIRGEDGEYKSQIDYEQFAANDIYRVNYAHFGLTLLRTTAVKSMPKPWFIERAGSDGRWAGTDKDCTNDGCDADIGFWQNWEKFGKSLYVTNNVPLGHFELAPVWLDRKMIRHVQPMKEWVEQGVPGNVLR